MRKYLPAFLIGAIYIVSVAPVFWYNDPVVVNWIWKNPRPMPIGWAMKYTADQLNWILIALAAYFLGVYPNRVNKTSMIVFLLWCILDCFAYFYNYKQIGYFAMYFWLPVAWLLIYYWRSKYSEKLWQILHDRK